MVRIALTLLVASIASVAPAQTPRQLLTQTVFFAQAKGTAISGIAGAEAAANAVLSKRPGDREALLMRAMATGYRAKLSNSRRDALAAKSQFEALVAANPRDPEAQAALGAWHLSGVASLGSLVARGALGAKRGVGLSAIDRAVALGGNRAMFAGLAALFRLELDPADPCAVSLAKAAAQAPAPTPADQLVQQRVTRILGTMQSAPAATVRATARRLLPLGQLAN